MLRSIAYQLRMAIDVGMKFFKTERAFAQLFIALLHSFAEGWVLQQPLPQGWCGIIVATLVAPRLYVGGVGQVAVAVGIVIVPNRTCKKFSTAAVLLLLLLVEISTAAIGIGIETQLRVNEIVYKGGHIDITGIATLGIGKVVGLNHLLHRIDIVLYIGQLFGL